MAALLDPDLFGLVEEELDLQLEGDAGALGPVVSAAAAAKIAVVERDPTEKGERRLLNFGHTLGHAIESACGYSGLRHGEAVGYGILFALRLARRRGLAPEVAARIHRLILRLGLPRLPELSAEELMAGMARDKKARESGLVWVLPRSLGEGWMVDGVPEHEVRGELADFLRDPLRRPV
jgi:3-dehydroquinate synthase